jgi:hypothetical protein
VNTSFEDKKINKGHITKLSIMLGFNCVCI